MVSGDLSGAVRIASSSSAAPAVLPPVLSK